MKKRKRTKFQAFAQRFLILSMTIFIFGSLMTKAKESEYINDIDDLKTEIDTLKSLNDGLEGKKQQLVSFERLTAIVEVKGYTYSSNSMAASTAGQNDGDGVNVE